MPRPMKPLPLVDLSLWFVVNFSLGVFRRPHTIRPEHIRRFLETLPTTLADRLTQALLEGASGCPIHFWYSSAIRYALGSRCSRLQVTRMKLSQMVKLQVMLNLDVLTGLTHLEVEPHLGCDWQDQQLVANLTNSLKRMPKLRVLRIGPVDDEELISELAQHCPDLQELSMTWEFRKRPTVCWDAIRSVCMSYYRYSLDDVSFILENIPHLSVLNVGDMMLSDLLDLIRNSHKPSFELRKLIVLEPEEASDIQSLLQKLPYLEELKAAGKMDMTGLSVMSNLRVLDIGYTEPKVIAQLVDTCFPRLHTLTLTYVRRLEQALESVQPMRGMSELYLYDCREFNVHIIAKVFPNLSRLMLMSCEVAPVESKPECDEPFRYLEFLRIYDRHDLFRLSHLEYLTGHCVDLQELGVTQTRGLDDNLLEHLLRKNPMTLLRTLRLASDRLTPSAMTTVFRYFGDQLQQASFYGHLVDQITPELKRQLKQMIQPYRMRLRANDLVFGDVQCGLTCRQFQRQS